MKEFVKYIGCKFRYGVEIHWYLKNKMKTGFPSPMRPNRNGYYR